MLRLFVGLARSVRDGSESMGIVARLGEHR
jgi:hypothetical protein